MNWRRRVCGLGAGLVALLFAAAPASAQSLLAAGPPLGFEETTVLDGLDLPTAVRFAPDGRIFVAEKGGRIELFDGLGDPTPQLYADLSTQVHDYWDRGLLGLALDPQFETRPYVYVLYTYNKDPNSPEMPRWPDSCPQADEDGCTVMNRLSRLHGGVEEVLIEDWCQQYPSHAIGSLAFGRDGALYVTGGDGASFDFADWGQEGIPPNPCNDPPGRYLSAPTSEGGALRSQDIRTRSDPTGLSGSILRLDPATALPAAGNPGTGSVNERRIIAHGLRNPFRMAFRPGTDEVWVGDVGWREWEEINRVPNPTGEVRNFGWPCYEGNGRQAGYETQGLNLCQSLYQAPGAASAPHFAYRHHQQINPTESCLLGTSSISGLAFTPEASSFPDRYDGALFFADYSRKCIWAMLAGANGVPDPTRVELFADGAANPAELQFGPGGDLYYVDISGGTIRRIRSTTTNPAPVARASATPSSGAVPLTVVVRRASLERHGIDVRVGPRRRRAVHRRIGRAGKPHVSGPGPLHSEAARARRGRPDRHAQPPHHGGDSARRHARHSDRGHDMGGRRPARAQRRGDGFGREPDSGEQPHLAPESPPLWPRRRRVLPHAYCRDVHRGLRDVHRAQPRVPFASRGRADGA